jgi:hypothetical protein
VERLMTADRSPWEKIWAAGACSRPTGTRFSWLLAFAVAAFGCQGQPPAVNVASAREVGVVGQSPLIVGRDGGWATRLWDREVFVFGDTFVSKPDVYGSSFHSNSFSFTDDSAASDGISGLADRVDAVGSPLPLLAPTADEAAFIAAHGGDDCAVKPCGARWATWPASVVWDAAGGRALVSYGLVYAEPGAWNFHGVGQSLAVWSDFSQQAIRPEPGNCPGHPTLLFCEGEPNWGAALVIDAGRVFAFACDEPGLSPGCLLASVPSARVLDRSAWRAWDTHTWTASLSAARPLFDGAPILRVHFNQHARSWMAVYSRPLTDDVVYRTAPALTGPWSDEARLFVADRRATDGSWTYDALVQPDYSEEDGRVVYVTFSRPTGMFSSELALVRVTFE